jgi:uncharacterized protein (TIGR02996 family)
MSMTEEDWLRAIQENPFDATPRLVYADWLEEHGDLQRAAEMRAGCRYRLPITPQERTHLAVIAAARDCADADCVEVTVTADQPGYTLIPDGDDMFLDINLADNLRHLSKGEIARNFPRDDKGRFQLDCAVLLARYQCTDHLPRGRQLWLAATGPHRQGSAPVITVELKPLIGDNHPHDWSRARFWWDDRAASLDDQARWGVTTAELRAVTGPGRGPRIAELKSREQAGTITPAERIALCTALQDDGKFEEALRLTGIEMTEELSRLLNDDLSHFRGGCDRPPATAVPVRAEKLRRALWEAAPWRFAAGLVERPGKACRLFIFPGSKHARKPCLMLLPGPRLCVEFTGSNTVMPETWWKRPLELDIARWQ